MGRLMLINTVEGHECRIAVVDSGVLQELYVERASSASRVGNIYKGRVTNVEAGIQAAFVDFGLVKNGFLHISDLNPQYFPRGHKTTEAVGRKHPHRDRPPIQECLRRGQEVVIQMTKEGIGTKGPTLTTYLSIPGRLLVMMPGMSRLGVSRKVEDEQARSQARQIIQALNPPPEVGIIVRTAGIDRPKKELQRDLNYLLRLWKSIGLRLRTAKAPTEIYQESDLVIRTIRDVYNSTIERIICDRPDVARRVKDFLDMAVPRGKHVIELYTGREGLFQEFGLEHEIEKIYSRRVDLKSGGWLAFDQAEALVAVDVNSGRSREHSDAETTALRTNLEAVGEIARQLRLRDLGGVVIIDFIDMREERNRRAVEKTLRDAVKDDRAKTKILKVSALGIVEMTRQRVRPSLRDSIHTPCALCEGTGRIKSEESQALAVIRSLQRAVAHEEIAQIEVAVTPPVEYHLANQQRRQIADLEASSGKRILIRTDAGLRGSEIRIACTNNRGGPVVWDTPAPAGGHAPATTQIESSATLPEEPEAELETLEVEAELPAPEEPAKAGEAAAPPPPPAQAPAPAPASAPQARQEAARKRRRGRRGGRKHRRKDTQAPTGAAAPQGAPPAAAQPARHATQPEKQPAHPPKPAGTPQTPAPSTVAPPQGETPASAAGNAAQAKPPPAKPSGPPGPEADPSAQPQKRRRSRRGGRRHHKKNAPQPAPAAPAEAPPPIKAPEPESQ